MFRTNVHRRIAALALVTALALAGARPAAAMELGFLDRLGSLWSAVTGGGAGIWESLAGWWGGERAPAAPNSPVKADMTTGTDPNGNSLVQQSQSPSLGEDDSH